MPFSRRRRQRRQSRQRRVSTGDGAAKPASEVGRKRVGLVLVAVMAVSLLLSGRAVYLSVVEGGGVPALAAEQTAASNSDLRGNVLSADGRMLATSLERYRLVATPYQIEDADVAARQLGEVVGEETDQTLEEIRKKLTRHDDRGNLSGYSVLGSVKPETAEKVEGLNLEGVTVTPSSTRIYPDGKLASQMVGHFGDYGEPFGGIEARYDEQLRSGEDITVTLDAAVQQELEKELADVMKEHRPRGALGLMMRVDDGAVVALAHAPTFDNNNFNKATPELQRNRVLTDPYEPGSTFKPFTMAAALEDGAVTERDSFTVADRIQVADRVIHDSEPHETKVMRPEDILEQSSNVGMIQVAQRLGGENLENYIRAFGFGEATGVDMWGEDPGVVPPYEEWSGSSIGNIPIGQGLTVTPLQLVRGYAALINGGTSVTPHMLKDEARAEPGTRVISRETSDIVRGMLQNVVENGSGHLAQIPGYTVGGKTGTSQKVDPETGAYAFKHVASFVGFAPASDPEFIALIVVDEPKTEYWGEVVAAPALQELMSFTLGYYNVPPDRGVSPQERGAAG